MTIEALIHFITERAQGRSRYLVAVAGPPGSGKSTLSQELVRRLSPSSAGLVPMDGFHYDNAVLDELGLRQRKGAPETFDCAGFAALLRRVKDLEPNVASPVFDRAADLARAAAAFIRPEMKYIIVEGNYLLLNQPPWPGLADFFDLTIFLDVPRVELRRRLIQRWLDLGDPLEKAEHWVSSNDMLNVDLVLTSRRVPDLYI